MLNRILPPAVFFATIFTFSSPCPGQPPFPFPPTKGLPPLPGSDDSESNIELPELSKLADALKSGTEEARLDAIERFQDIAGSAREKLSVLKESLDSDNDVIRMSVLESIGKLNQEDPDVIARLKQIVSEGENPFERVLASGATLEMTDDPETRDETIAELSNALRSQDPAVSNEAAKALRGGGLAAEQTLVEALSDENSQTRALAAEVLGDIGSAAADDQLINLLQDSDASVRAAAAQALGRKDNESPQAIESLIKVMEDDSQPSIRATAATSLAQMAPADQRVSDALGSAAGDSDPVVSAAAIRALANVEIDAASRTRLLAARLPDADPMVAAEIVGQLVELGDDGLKALTSSLQDKRSRYWAVIGLSDLGPKASGAATDLAKVLDSSPPQTQVEILLALANIKPPAESVSNEVSQQLLSDNDSVRYAASLAAVRIGFSDVKTQNALQANTSDNDKMLRLISRFALAKLNPGNPRLGIEAIQALGEVIASKDERLAPLAAQALKELRN